MNQKEQKDPSGADRLIKSLKEVSERIKTSGLRVLHPGDSKEQELADLGQEFDQDEMFKLYKDRADLVDFESTVDEKKKYMEVDGWFWRIYEWMDRKAKEHRAKIQAEIDLINERRRQQ